MAEVNEKVNQIIEIFNKENNIYIKDVEQFKRKLAKVITEKAKSIQIITDFDMTITQYWKDGKRTITSHNIITGSKLISEDYRKKSEELFNKYYPYEISTEISFEEKYKYMNDWWSKAHQLIIDQKLTKGALVNLVKESPVVFRQGFKDLFNICKKKDIPFMISSAGVQNVIEEVFSQANLNYDKFIVRSNCMEFSPDTNICVSFKKPIIHSLNKNELKLVDSKYKEIIKDKKNVFLFGDSISDIDMLNSVECEECISFGFLNLEKKEKLEKYMNVFDVVITDDGSFEFANEILQSIN